MASDKDISKVQGNAARNRRSVNAVVSGAKHTPAADKSGSGKVSIYGIAERLGVSASTVSRALNDHPAISVKVKTAVQELAKELHFRPNNLAVALKTGKPKTIGIIVPQINRTYFVEAIAGVERELYKAGYDLIIASSGNMYERECKVVNSLGRGKVVGVIAAVAAETTNYAHYQRLVDNGIPIVMFDRRMPIANTSFVAQNDFIGAYNATQHLIEQGCRKLYHFGGPQNVSLWRERKEGFCKALSDAGLAIEENAVHIAITTEEEGRKYAENMLRQGHLPDGILFAGDFAARAAMEVFTVAGVRIPQDIAVVGFVNEPWDKLLSPPLSSVEQFPGLIGETAARMMLEAIEGMPARSVVFDTELIVRASSLKSGNAESGTGL
ncbi:MAG: LacI family DNA-binding transcriptional regulator [Alistipes sp.]